MNNKKNTTDSITRKEAIKKMGKYAALTAAGTFLVLNPLKAQTSSPPGADGDPFAGG
ncbi:MAG: hypothetical protein Wins2KO_26900 [Winogradskyella sp.]